MAGAGPARLFIDINVPQGCEILDKMLRDWVEQVYVPTLARGGVFVGMTQGEMEINFDVTFDGNYYAGVSMRGAVSFAREGQEDAVMQLAESLNIDRINHELLSPAALLDVHDLAPVLALLYEALLKKAPTAQPYVGDMNQNWLAGALLG